MPVMSSLKFQKQYLKTQDLNKTYVKSLSANIKKIEIVGQLFDFAVTTKSQFFRKKYPESSDLEIMKMTLESIERGTR